MLKIVSIRFKHWLSFSEAAAFSCTKFVFFLPHAFFCLKMLFFAPLHFSASSLRFFPPPVLDCLKLFERASRFFTVHICFNSFNLWIFHWQKVNALPFSSSLSQDLLEILIFAKSGKIDCYSKTSLFPISLQVFQKKSLNFCEVCMIIAKI